MKFVAHTQLPILALGGVLAAASGRGSLPASAVEHKVEGVTALTYIGGAINAVEKEGGRLYWAEGGRVVVATVSATGNVTPLGESIDHYAIIRDLSAAGDILVAASGWGGLQLFDDIDLLPPKGTRIAGKHVSGEAWAVTYNGDRFFVAAGDRGLLALRSTGGDLLELNSLVLGRSAIDVVVEGDTAYVLGGRIDGNGRRVGGTVYVVDISDEEDMFVSATVPMGEFVGAIEVVDSVLYAGVVGGVIALDLSDPLGPGVIVRTDCKMAAPAIFGFGYSTDIAIHGDTLLLATGSEYPRTGGVCMFAVVAGKELEWQANPLVDSGGTTDIYMDEADTFVAGGTSGDIYHATSIVTTMSLALLVEHSGATSDISIESSLGIVATDGGLAALDLNDPREPRDISASRGGTSHRWGVELETDGAEVIAYNLGPAYDLYGIYLSAYQFTSGGEFNRVSSTMLAGGWRAPPTRTVLAEDVLFVANQSAGRSLSAGVLAVDVSDASSPRELARYRSESDVLDLAGYPQELHVLATTSSELLLLDFSTSVPTAVARLPLSGSATAIASKGALAALAVDHTIILLVASDSRFLKIGEVSLDGYISELQFIPEEDDHRLFAGVSSEDGGEDEHKLVMIDTSDMAEIRVVEESRICGPIIDMDVEESTGAFYTVAGGCGITVFGEGRQHKQLIFLPIASVQGRYRNP